MIPVFAISTKISGRDREISHHADLGLSSAKVYFIERAQFLLLEILSSRTTWRGDDSHMISLVDLLCSTAIMLGFILEYKRNIQNQENIVGSKESLENFRVWIILSDFNVSLKYWEMFKH